APGGRSRADRRSGGLPRERPPRRVLSGPPTSRIALPAVLGYKVREQATIAPRGGPSMNATAHDIPSLRDKVSPEEWAVRVDLAACYRLVAHYGWEDLVFTHITARVPSTEDQFLINPYGMFFDEITASSLVKIDIHGSKVQDSPYPVNPAGFVIHSAIHAARHDARCVLHTPTLNGVAVSAQRAGLLPISQHSISVLGAWATTTSRVRRCETTRSRGSSRTS